MTDNAMVEPEVIERVARILEPQAWRALGLCDTLAYKNRRTSSLRKATAAINEFMKVCPTCGQPGCRDME